MDVTTFNLEVVTSITSDHIMGNNSKSTLNW